MYINIYIYLCIKCMYISHKEGNRKKSERKKWQGMNFFSFFFFIFVGLISLVILEEEEEEEEGKKNRKMKKENICWMKEGE